MKKSKKRTLTVVVLLAVLIIFLNGVVVPRVFYPIKYSEYVDEYSEEYGLDKAVVYAVIKAESSFNPENSSHVGAVGLMQIMPETGEWVAEKMGIEDFQAESLYDPDVNINTGCWYLRFLLDTYSENLPTALAAYNAGHGNVKKWLENPEYSSDGLTLDVIPYAETEGYVKRTLKYIERYEKYYDEL